MGRIENLRNGYLFFAICAAIGVTGCGGGGHASSLQHVPPEAGRPALPASAFPDASGKTLREVLKATDKPLTQAGLLAEPTAMVFYGGRNRYPVQITTKSGTPVQSVDVALYLAEVPSPSSGTHHAGKAPSAQAQVKALDNRAEGPFPARMETLATEARFTASSTTEDPRSATVVYVGALDFPRDGEWRVGAVVKDGNETFSALLPNISVGEFRRVPRVGQPAPQIHTPISRFLKGEAGSVSTRNPPSTLNEVDFASVLGKKPVVLVFASPKFSWNRTGGPTLDVAEQVAAEVGKRATFINVEIYNHNDPGDGVRPQVRAYHLPSEPWVFAINRSGQVTAEAEGAVGVSEMKALVKKALAQ
jgi:hypothetical protein